MLKANIKEAELGLNDPLITSFNISYADVYGECHSIAEVIAMTRLFKQLAIDRQDFITANRFRELENKLKQQAADFEATWAWMNATQMQDEIKKQVAALLPTLSFRPELGTVEKTPNPPGDDGPNYGNNGNELRRRNQAILAEVRGRPEQPSRQSADASTTPFMTAEGA